MSTRESLSQEQRKTLSWLILLDEIIANNKKVHISLLDPDEELLNQHYSAMAVEGLLEINSDNYYQATTKGQQAYDKLLKQLQNYTQHLEIYAWVDLEQGVFADPDNDLLEDERWADLRVAVAEYKNIDPYQMVLLAMLSDGSLTQTETWRFDLVSGELFNELEAVVAEQINEDELAYEDEEGKVSGKEVLEDVIFQGSQINQERAAKQKKQEDQDNSNQKSDRQTNSNSAEQDDVWYDPYW